MSAVKYSDPAHEVNYLLLPSKSIKFSLFLEETAFLILSKRGSGDLDSPQIEVLILDHPFTLDAQFEPFVIKLVKYVHIHNVIGEAETSSLLAVAVQIHPLK